MPDPGSGLGGSGEPIPGGRPPPEDSDFYLDWAKSNVKESVKTANSFLSQVLSLSASLLGGSIVLWKSLDFQWTFKVLMIVLWSACVCVSLFSFSPIEGDVDIKSASDARDLMEAVYAAKSRRITIVKWCFAGAIAAATVGLLIGNSIPIDAIWPWLRARL
jgi:hypothetical protein